jgi:hypothetical protein
MNGGDPEDEQAAADRIRAALKRVLAETNKNLAQWCSEAGVKENIVRNFLAGRSSSILTSNLIKLASAIRYPVGRLIDENARLMPLTGRMIARGRIITVTPEENAMLLVEAPPDYDSKMRALAVTVDTLRPDFEQHDTVYYRDTWEPPEGLYGIRCVIRLPDGELVVGRLRQGSMMGTSTIERINAAPLIDVQVQEATPIRWVRPAL